MRGKKIDSHFISDFIQKCVKKGLETPDDITSCAQKMINEIDEEIKSIEKRKVLRSKLLDVVNTFNKSIKTPKDEEVRVLSFFKIKQPIICKHICDILKKSPVTIDSFNGSFNKEDLLFCIKQLIEYKVISKSNNIFLRGEMFEDYIKHVLKDI